MIDLDPPAVLCQRCDTTARFPYSAREYAAKAMWFVVQSTLFRLPLPRLSGWRRMLLRCFGASIDPTAVVSSTVTVWHPWLLKIGEYSALSDRVCVYNLGWVVIGSHSVLSQDVYLCGGTHDYTKANLPLVRKPIVVGHGVWLCAGAFVGPGVTVGDNAIVGARAVVMSDVPPRVVTFGNPARVIRDRPMPDSDEGRTGTGSQAGGNDSQ
jgi:putative colanic acid biosynthesis acetyltransferase WcaF